MIEHAAGLDDFDPFDRVDPVAAIALVHSVGIA